MSTFTQAEKDELVEKFNNSINYLEYGAGESTVLASYSKSIKNIDSIETVSYWVNHVNSKINKDNKEIKIHYIDINSNINYYAYPIDESKKENWPLYQQSSKDKNFDLCLVDGRFRVATFLNCCINAPIDCCLIIHDYQREYYHDVENIIKKHNQTDNLAVFYKKKQINYSKTLDLIEKYKNDPR